MPYNFFFFLSDDATNELNVLRNFDLESEYGPCMGNNIFLYLYPSLLAFVIFRILLISGMI